VKKLSARTRWRAVEGLGGRTHPSLFIGGLLRRDSAQQTDMEEHAYESTCMFDGDDSVCCGAVAAMAGSTVNLVTLCRGACGGGGLSMTGSVNTNKG
jgi:hypothetical protein